MNSTDKHYHNTRRGSLGHQQEDSAFTHLNSKYSKVERLDAKYDQIHRGDFYCDELGYVEFKGEKKVFARDQFAELDLILIEFTNNWGYKGWLYKEFTNLFMFKIGQKYLFVKKESLIKKAEELCVNINNPTRIKFGDGKTKLPYECYQRWDSKRKTWRKDSCAHIRASDIRSLKKGEEYWFEDSKQQEKKYEDPSPLL